MNSEIQSIITDFQNVLNNEPWFGRSFYAIVNEIDPAIVYKKLASPAGEPNENAHSLIELLYHSLTWAEYTLKILENANEEELKAIRKLDWREIDPNIHTWEKAIADFKITHEKIIKLLEQKDDSFLDEKVKPHTFTYKTLLNGLIQHDIYHLGQIAYVKKMLS